MQRREKARHNHLICMLSNLLLTRLFAIPSFARTPRPQRKSGQQKDEAVQRVLSVGALGREALARYRRGAKVFRRG